MVNKLVRLTSEQRANFVAYLDGELEERETQQIEQLLAHNEIARHDMESLASAWELLDELPRPHAPENFTQKTLATLQMEDRQVPLQEQAWYQAAIYYTRVILGAFLILSCAAAGFVAARSFPPSQADVMINNYPVLINLNQYQEIGSLEFLEQLQKNPEWLQRKQHTSQGGK